MSAYEGIKSPAEVLTDEMRGCCNGYIGAPALAVQCVAALRAAGWLIVRHDAIRLAQAQARDELRADNENKPRHEEQYLPYAGADFF